MLEVSAKLSLELKKGIARDLFHAACVGGLGFCFPKDPHSATRGDPVVLEAVRSFNIKFLVSAAGTCKFVFLGASGMTVPYRQIIILSVKHTWSPYGQ